ncbi:MAG TPA: hypothetical protein VHF90_07190 [Thermoleophilaceae bacterium]|nr:hypothetical protein [Thermoleophilaceae bacterium]
MLGFFNDRSQLSARLAIAAGALWAAMGALQAARPDYLTTDVIEHPLEHVMMGALSLVLLLMIPGYALLSRYATDAKPVLFVAAGNVALAATVTVSNVMGDDPSWFAIAAPITNALWFFGSIALAVLLRKAGHVPTWVYVGLPLAWIAALPLSPIGGPLLTGAYWIALGYMLLAGAFERGATTRAVAA